VNERQATMMFEAIENAQRLAHEWEKEHRIMTTAQTDRLASDVYGAKMAFEGDYAEPLWRHLDRLFRRVDVLERENERLREAVARLSKNLDE
jgi:hypothetical protein